MRNAKWCAFPLTMILIGVRSVALCAVDCDTGDYGQRLIKRYDQCLDRQIALVNDQKVLVAEFDKAPAAKIGLAETAVRLLNRRRDEITRLTGVGAEQREVLRRKVEEAQAQAGAVIALPDIDTGNGFPMLKPDEWRAIDDEPGKGFARHLPADVLSSASCLDATKATPVCEEAYKAATQLGDEIYRVSVIVWELRDVNRRQFQADANLREKQWHAYLYDTQLQYFWEMGLNRSLEEQCGIGDEVSLAGRAYRGLVGLVGKKCNGIKKDDVGNRVGFRGVPDFRAVFFHPDIGVQYLSDQVDGQKIKPALVFQWVGLQWWNWAEGRVTRLQGASLVTTVADHANENRVGWGAQYQYGDYAVAVTNHGGTWALTLNLRLVDRISTINEDAANRLKQLTPKQ